MSKTLDYDYIAEVSAGHDETVRAVSYAFCQEWNMATRPESPRSLKYISNARESSFYKTIFKAIPAQIEWEVTRTDSSASQVRMCIKLPAKYCLNLYIIPFAFMMLIYYLTWAADEYLYSTLSTTIVKSTLLAMTLPPLIFFGKKVGCLFERYRGELDTLVSQLNVECKSLEGSVKTSYKVLLSWFFMSIGPVLVFVILILRLVYSSYYTKTEFDPSIVSPMTRPVLGGMIFISFLTLTIALAAERGRYPARMLAPLIVHFTLVTGLLFLLAVAPLSMECIIQIGFAQMDYTGAFATFDGPRIIHVELGRWWTPLEDKEISQYQRRIATGIGLVPLMAWFVGVTLLSFNAEEFSSGAGTSDSKHQRIMRCIYKSKSRLESGLMPQRMSSVCRVSVWLFFLCLAVLCWCAVLLNISVACALIDPGLLSCCLSDGAILVRGMQFLASDLLSVNPQDEALAFLIGKLVLAPILLPFAIFVLLHIHYWIRQYRRNRSLVCLEGELATKAEYVAKAMKVKDVSCFLDEEHKEVSPYAQVRGLIAQKRIVFGPETLSFFAKYPKYVEPVIAHEVAHLQKHCRRIRRLRILSRLGLSGVALLGLTLDPISIEDEADDSARDDYLVKKMKGEADDIDINCLTEKAADLIGNAAFAIGLWRCPKEYKMKFSSSRNAAFAQMAVPPSNKSCKRQTSVFQRIRRNLRAAYEVYFELDAYHYIHREVRLRRSRLSSEAATKKI